MKITLVRNIDKSTFEFANKAELEDFMFEIIPDNLGEIIGKPESKWTIQDMLDNLPYCEYTVKSKS